MKPNFKKIKADKLREQLKFFGAKKTRFISCYAKKPRVRIVEEKTYFECSENNHDYLTNAGLANLQANNGAAIASLPSTGGLVAAVPTPIFGRSHQPATVQAHSIDMAMRAVEAQMHALESARRAQPASLISGDFKWY